MSSGWLGQRRFRFDAAHPPMSGMGTSSAVRTAPTGHSQRLQSAIGRTREYLLAQQHPEGYWVGELEGDTILESEYILLLAFLGRGQSETARKAANYILQQQQPTGGWAIYPDGPLEISASVKSYLALKITGHDSNAPYMVAAREAIRAAGGAERVNSFTRFYLALLGIISYHQVPAVPPEIILLPPWAPFNIYEMSAWSRTIVIPLSLLWAFRPSCRLPADQQIDELFLNSPQALPVTMGPAEVVDAMRTRTWLDWGRVFRGIDRGIKVLERLHIKPLRRLAIRRATAWMQERFEDSDGLGAIFPPIVWSIIALKCLGHTDESPEVQRALQELENLSIHEGDTIRLQPCKSPVWDTAIATIALRESGVPPEDPSLNRAVEWLLSKEVRHSGDWSIRKPQAEPSGWYFEFNNRFYPDVDDTCMVVMALTRCLPEGQSQPWRAEYLLGGPPGTPAENQIATILTRSHHDGLVAVADIEKMRPLLSAIGRGARWVMDMQNNDGGWGAFDNNNDREILTRVPFADHNAMIDPSTADLTSRMLEMFAGLGMTIDHPVAQRALNFLWAEQEPDHAWFGRWGVNYIYGTWQTLVGLEAIGVPHSDPRVRRAVAWLKMMQQDSGGWGESPQTYDDPRLRGQGTPTASQTAWALMGLIAGGEVNCPAVDAGLQYLFDTQLDDGTWDEEPYTGTGFPRVFYLKYHLYRIYFPLMAMARVANVRRGQSAVNLQI